MKRGNNCCSLIIYNTILLRQQSAVAYNILRSTRLKKYCLNKNLDYYYRRPMLEAAESRKDQKRVQKVYLMSKSKPRYNFNGLLTEMGDIRLFARRKQGRIRSHRNSEMQTFPVCPMASHLYSICKGTFLQLKPGIMIRDRVQPYAM